MELTQMIKKSGYAPSVRLLNIQKVKREEEICSLLQMQPDEQLVVAEKLFLADDKICAFCRDYFGMNLIGGEEAFDMFSKYEDSIYKYIYELSGEKAQWDKVEIDTVNPAEIAGLKKYVSVKELGLSPYLYLKTLNYSEKDKPLVYANEYFNTEIIKFNLIRQKNITNLKKKSEDKGKPDLNILFIYNMPFRGIAKMTHGAVSMKMAEGMAEVVNGHFMKGMKKVLGGFFENRKANKEYEKKLGTGK